jgi:hypothetical protein
MFELPLHAGTEHADLTWIVLSGILTFLAGIGIGMYRHRLREFVRTIDPTAGR